MFSDVFNVLRLWTKLQRFFRYSKSDDKYSVIFLQKKV